MRRKIVSEKTLELNVSASILEIIRARWAECQNAFWIGMKQYQEARNGIDELLANVPTGRHLALQFKAPSPRHLDTEPYEYGLGEDQLARLMRLAATRPHGVHYVFPHYNSFSRMRTDAPDLLLHTYLLPVSSIRGLGPVVGGTRRHRAESWETPPWVQVHSDPVELESVNAKAYFFEATPEFAGELLLTNDELAQWLREVAAPPNDKPAAIGQRLRGFSTVCIPR